MANLEKPGKKHGYGNNELMVIDSNSEDLEDEALTGFMPLDLASKQDSLDSLKQRHFSEYILLTDLRFIE